MCLKPSLRRYLVTYRNWPKVEISTGQQLLLYDPSPINHLHPHLLPYQQRLVLKTLTAQYD
jgi:hypothetical protein